jgi:prevent-host-death family protein
MTQVNMHEAKSRLSQLVAEVEGGGEVVLARAGVPVARIVPYAAEPLPERKFGAMKGRARVDDSFFDPLPPEEMQYWE